MTEEEDYFFDKVKDRESGSTPRGKAGGAGRAGRQLGSKLRRCPRPHPLLSVPVCPHKVGLTLLRDISALTLCCVSSLCPVCPCLHHVCHLPYAPPHPCPCRLKLSSALWGAGVWAGAQWAQSAPGFLQMR